MASSLKSTSSTIIISGSVTESAPSTFTQATIDLQLNPLDNEVFVIQSVDIDVNTPDGIAATNTEVAASLSNTSRTTLGNISNTNVFAATASAIRGAGYLDAGVGFQHVKPDSPTAMNLDYIAILATDAFFAQIQAQGNANAKTMNFKIYGFRARATSSTYAALVQSELLSS